MTFPNKLQQIVNEAWMAMHLHRTHHLMPYYRFHIYEQLKLFNSSAKLPQAPRALAPDSLGDRARGWLAIIAAEKVMPIFTSATYSSEVEELQLLAMPEEQLQIARAIMHGTANPEKAFGKASEFHQAFGGILDEGNYDPIGFPVNASIAGWSTMNALLEAVGWDTLGFELANELQQTQHPSSRLIYRNETPFPLDVSKSQLLWKEDKRGSMLDTAGVAASAYSCSAKSDECDPARLEEFWTWWLKDALPLAWANALEF